MLSQPNDMGTDGMPAGARTVSAEAEAFHTEDIHMWSCTRFPMTAEPSAYDKVYLHV